MIKPEQDSASWVAENNAVWSESRDWAQLVSAAISLGTGGNDRSNASCVAAKNRVSNRPGSVFFGQNTRWSENWSLHEQLIRTVIENR